MSRLADLHDEHRGRRGGPRGTVRAPIWARPEPGSRRPRYTRKRIAEVALSIADREGFEAVAMRRVAAELQASPMSLYHYVDGKNDLVALMDDALLEEALVPAGELPSGWRDAVAAIARRTREVFLRHPWALAALHGENAAPWIVTPHSMAHVEQSLSALEDAPLTTAGKFELLAAVDDFVNGHALRAGEAAMRRGLPPAVGEAARAYGQSLVESGEFPHLAALAAGDDDDVGKSLLDPERLDEQFERGLCILLDHWPLDAKGL